MAAGAPLTEVGQLLRHRKALTTAIYAKVDATPWPPSPALGRSVRHEPGSPPARRGDPGTQNTYQDTLTRLRAVAGDRLPTAELTPEIYE